MSGDQVDRLGLIGFDPPEADQLAERFRRAGGGECLAHPMLPKVVVEGGQLFIESPTGMGYRRVQRIVYHGIFADDLETLAGLALWGGPCFPNPVGLMRCRLRLPCLVLALLHTRFGGPRDFASRGGDYMCETATVAKWGNWHCGENKERFVGPWHATEPTLFEPFHTGVAVRVVLIGSTAWQIRMAGPDWKKSVHDPAALLLPLDEALLADTQQLRAALGLDLIATDYLLTENGPYLLEVNHIPSVTCFPELWQAYLDTLTHWFQPAAPFDST